jgi:hypothetical protein
MAAPGVAPEQPDLASVLEGPDADDPEAHRAGEDALAQAEAAGQPALALPAPPDAGAAAAQHLWAAGIHHQHACKPCTARVHHYH